MAERATALLESRSQVGIGVHDGLSALLACRAGCDFLWVSSFSMSAAAGIADAGLLDAGDVAAVVAQVARAAQVPVVVDMDAGYGDPLRVHHAANRLLRSGATALCIEDNPTAKRSSLYAGGRCLASVEEHCARLRAARRAAEGHDAAVIARTEALVAGLGVDEALARASAFVEAGAQAVFVQAVGERGPGELLDFLRRWRWRTGVFVAPSRYPWMSRAELHDAGASHYIFPNQGIRAAHRAMAETFADLMRSGSGRDAEDRVSSIDELSAEVGVVLTDGRAHVGLTDALA